MFFAGLAKGFADAQTQDRQLQAGIDEKNAEREQAALEHLSTIPGDDNADIRAHALAAMLNPQRKPGGFLAALTNQNKKNPALPTIQALMASGVQKPVMQQTEPTPSTMIEGAKLPAAEGPPPGVEGTSIPQTSLGAVHNALPQAPGASAQVGTQTVARHIPSTSEIAGQTEFEQEKGKVGGALAGVDLAFPETGNEPPGDPNHKAALKSVATIHALGLQTGQHVDDEGTLNITGPTGQVIASVPHAGKGTSSEEAIKTQARNLTAAGASPATAETTARTNAATATTAKQETAVSGASTAASRATLTSAQAALAPEMAAARLAATKQTTLTGQAREKFMAAETVSAWQKVNGTTPMSPAQQVNAAREILGNDPNITSADVTRVASGIAAAQRGGGGAGSTAAPPPAAGASAPRTPAPGATGATPPPSAVERAVAGAGLGGTAKNFKSYSAAGKQTIQALDTVSALLPKIEAAIKTQGLENSNNPLPEKFASLLYGFGVSPGADMETLLQNAGMSKGYGLRGLLGGRGNQQLQAVYAQHLLDQGDSPKLMLQKIRTLQANIPDIRAAVDDAENAHIGQKTTGPATPPPGAHPNSSLPDGQPFTGPDGKTYIKTGTNPDGTVRGRPQ